MLKTKQKYHVVIAEKRCLWDGDYEEYERADTYTYAKSEQQAVNNVRVRIAESLGFRSRAGVVEEWGYDGCRFLYAKKVERVA